MDQVINTLADLWLKDVHQFSQPWMYYWLFIPAIIYLIIYIIKWSVLTFPLWGPIAIYVNIMFFKKNSCNDCPFKDEFIKDEIFSDLLIESENKE